MTSWIRIALVLAMGVIVGTGSVYAKGNKGAAPGDAKADKAKENKSKGVEVTLAEVDKVVKDAIEKAVADEKTATLGKIFKTEGQKKLAGKTLYVLHLTKDTRKGMMVVDDAGVIVKPVKYREAKPKGEGKRKEKAPK